MFVEDLAARVLAAALAMLAVAVSYDVVGRRLFGLGAAWVTEASEYLLVYLTFLLAPWILRNGGHVREEFVVQRLSPRGRRAASLAMSALALGTFFTLALVTCETALDLYRKKVMVGAILSFPKWAFFAPTAGGFLLVSLELARQIVALLYERRGSE